MKVTFNEEDVKRILIGHVKSLIQGADNKCFEVPRSTYGDWEVEISDKTEEEEAS